MSKPITIKQFRAKLRKLPQDALVLLENVHNPHSAKFEFVPEELEVEEIGCDSDYADFFRVFDDDDEIYPTAIEIKEAIIL